MARLERIEMPKRHVVRPKDWDSVFRRLEELVLANSGGDVFEEIFKLIIAKIWEERAVLHEPFVFCPHPYPAGLSAAISSLLHSADSAWPGVLCGDTSSTLTEEHLAVCVDMLSHHRFADASFEFMDSMFEMLVSQTAKGSKGQYFTPRHVVELCVRMLRPRPGELICDPACGSGAFLIHSLRKEMSEFKPGGNDDTASPAETIWGFDFDPRAVRVAKSLMILGGHGASNIYRVNSLLTPATSVDLFRIGDSSPVLTIEDVMRTQAKHFRGFDLILTNPPFAGEIKESHILQAYSSVVAKRRIERDALFLERCVQLLRPGGRMAIVLPHNKLGSESWAYLRKWFVQHVRVIASVGLGRNTFLPHTHQKADILVGVKRSKPAYDFDDEKIFFAVSEREGKNSKGEFVQTKTGSSTSSLWDRVDHDLGDIANAFSQHCKSDSLNWGY
jgi:type I restriction enzyme M protein